MTDEKAREPIAAGVFRDGSDGARARRDYLLEKRRHDYAVLSHSVRRIYVGRVARAAAGGVALLGALLTLVGAADPGAYEWLLANTPGPYPAPLTTLLLATAIGSVMSYFVARSVAEDYYARIISRSVQASDDLYADLERLAHIRPELVAYRLADRAELASLALPYIGACLFIPLMALYGLVAFDHNNVHVPTEFDGVLLQFVEFMLPALALVGVLAVHGAHRLRRLSARDRLDIGWSRSGVWYMANAVAFISCWAAFGTRGEKVSMALILMALMGLTVLGWLIGARLGSERTTLNEMFTRARDGARGDSMR